MKPEETFEEIARLMREINPSSLRIGSLNGRHANFADLDDDSHVKVQVRWRPPQLVACIVFEHTTNPILNDAAANRVSNLFKGEIKAGLLSRNDSPQLRVLEYVIPLDNYAAVHDLARTATLALLMFLNRTRGQLRSLRV